MMTQAIDDFLRAKYLLGFKFSLTTFRFALAIVSNLTHREFKFSRRCNKIYDFCLFVRWSKM